MSAVRLQFKDFLFPANPYTVEISTAKTLSDQKAPGWRTTTQEICADPAVITVQGELYGDTAREEMHAMTALQRESGSGELYIPYDDSRRVFFEKLTFTIAADGEKNTPVPPRGTIPLSRSGGGRPRRPIADRTG